ncbi:hypothetical protein MSG28_007260 [Choristoneura fumiferana]|uniref:Uncharacterized protein n=1 Tax=Choristoneura fumiferana TaxID=7141 RepID=A0ACC0JWF3_CHOFU|nr:hypothetical protein MSG28_007260 [Choristoneura fumiferana]
MRSEKINHVAAETDGGIPTLLRGGTGYRHFVVLVRAPPGRPLRGRVRVFCYNYTLDDDLPLTQIE